MPVAQLVALRNKKNGVTVLTPDPRDPKSYLEFQAAGDPSGGDIQYISEEMAATPACVRAILHGVFELEQDTMSPDVAQAFHTQMKVAQRQREQAQAAVAQTIERTENKDMVSVPCIGPAPGGRACETPVPMRDKERADFPPLCPQHVGLRAEYIPMEDFDGEKKKTRWIRTTIGAREREHG